MFRSADIVPIADGSHAFQPSEGLEKDRAVLVSAAFGNLSCGKIGLFQQLLRVGNPALRDILHRRNPRVFFKYVREVIFADVQLVADVFDGFYFCKIFGQIIVDARKSHVFYERPFGHVDEPQDTRQNELRPVSGDDLAVCEYALRFVDQRLKIKFKFFRAVPV